MERNNATHKAQTATIEVGDDMAFNVPAHNPDRVDYLKEACAEIPDKDFATWTYEATLQVAARWDVGIVDAKAFLKRQGVLSE